MEERKRRRSLQAGRDKCYDRGAQSAKKVLAQPETHVSRGFSEGAQDAKKTVSSKELRSELCSKQRVMIVQNYWTLRVTGTQ